MPSQPRPSLEPENSRKEAANAGRPGLTHDWPLHLGCFRERREKTREQEPRTRKEPREGEGQTDQSRKGASERSAQKR